MTRVTYEIVEHDGLYTWMPPTKVLEKPGPKGSVLYETVLIDAHLQDPDGDVESPVTGTGASSPTWAASGA